MRVKKKRNKKKVPTSKILLAGTFLISIEILVFCEVAYFFNPDATILIALLGVPVSIVPVALGYLKKSCAENTSGGIVYETVMSNRGDQAGIGD
jgi:hypothetical protein